MRKASCVKMWWCYFDVCTIYRFLIHRLETFKRSAYRVDIMLFTERFDVSYKNKRNRGKFLRIARNCPIVFMVTAASICPACLILWGEVSDLL